MGCEEIGWDKIIEIMLEEAERRKAPVLKLKFENSFQHLLFAVMSSRTRDEKTARAAKKLFRKVKKPKDLMKMNEDEIAQEIRSVGFYQVKAKRLKEIAEIIVRDYNSVIPEDFEELLRLPGIGRKTANVFLAHAAGKPAIAVDTHVHRIANRMGFVHTEKPHETELELKKLVPEGLWVKLNRAFVGYGQALCKPVRPLCSECKFNKCCSKIGVKVNKTDK